MANQSVWDEIEWKIRSGYPYFYLVSFEENRVAANLRQMAKRIGGTFTAWSPYSGFKPELDAKGNSPLEDIVQSEKDGLFLLGDYHRRLNETEILRQFKDLRETLAKRRVAVFVCAPTVVLPLELEKQFTVMDIPLPDVPELRLLLSGLCKQRKVEASPESVEKMARAAAGLTAEEALLVFSRMTLEPQRVAEADTSVIVEEKRRLVASEGTLQFFDRPTTLDDVGGLTSLKEWLKERDAAFNAEARAFGLPEPKGLLLLGVQGCGKSLTAKAVAAHWKLPLVQLDLGAAFSSSSGPEEAIRRALRLLEAMSPVVVWIDEIEKGFAGTKQADGEAAMHRVFGHFITWLQEKRKPVFVVATANRVEDLPPELLRKGRFDELFFVDLPDSHERKEIFVVHLKARRLDPTAFDLDELTDLSRNFTGAEIEQIVSDAMYRAFARKRPVEEADLLAATRTVVPLYNTYEEDIKKLRDWAKDRTRRASVDNTLMDYFQKEE